MTTMYSSDAYRCDNCGEIITGEIVVIPLYDNDDTGPCYYMCLECYSPGEEIQGSKPVRLSVQPAQGAVAVMTDR